MMESSERFRLLRDIQQEFEDEVATLPAPLRSAVLRSYKPDDYDSPGLLSLAALPFWLGEVFGISPLICRDLAVGNLFLLHLFQSFDSIVDEDRPDVDTRSQIVLGNLCYHKVLGRYLPHLPAGGVFWERMAHYWREWAECMLWEITPSPAGGPPYTKGLDDVSVHISAHKAAALKICPTVLALISEQPDCIPILEEAVDGMHCVMQLVDDLFDWQEDYRHGRYNALLALMVSQGIIDVAEFALPDELKTCFEAERLTLALMDEGLCQMYYEVVQDFARQATTAIAAAPIMPTERKAALQPWIRLVNGLVEQTRYMIDQYTDVPHLFRRPDAPVKERR